MELTPLLSPSELMQLMQLLKNAQRVVILGHSAPDGDAMGSTLGWSEYLRHLGKHVTIVMPNPAADFLKWLPGAQYVLFYTEEEHQARARRAIQEADLICCLDFNQLSRVRDDVRALVEKSKAPRLMIDHHLNPEVETMTMVISRPSASSASELVFRVINELGGYDSMTRSGACCIYCGIMCDTGAFAFNSSDPELYLIIAMLLAKGIDIARQSSAPALPPAKSSAKAPSCFALRAEPTKMKLMSTLQPWRASSGSSPRTSPP